MIESALYEGDVSHLRVRPRRHFLRYRAFWLLLDLDRLDEIAARTRFFSRNRFDLLSFHDGDHGDGGSRPLREQAEVLAGAAGADVCGGRVLLFTLPRILGYAFNPISVYFCLDRDDVLQAVIYQVDNTFGERHAYVIPVADPQARVIRQRCGKAMHVSPFMPMDLRYRFLLTRPEETFSLAVSAADGDGTVISAVLSTRRRPITAATLLAACLRVPFAGLKTMAAIHVEAARLWFKGLRFHRQPPPPERPATVVRSPAPTPVN